MVHSLEPLVTRVVFELRRTTTYEIDESTDGGRLLTFIFPLGPRSDFPVRRYSTDTWSALASFSVSSVSGSARPLIHVTSLRSGTPTSSARSRLSKGGPSSGSFRLRSSRSRRILRPIVSSNKSGSSRRIKNEPKRNTRRRVDRFAERARDTDDGRTCGVGIGPRRPQRQSEHREPPGRIEGGRATHLVSRNVLLRYADLSARRLLRANAVCGPDPMARRPRRALTPRTRQSPGPPGCGSDSTA